MQLARCPICHSRFSLEALIQDEATSDLVAFVNDLEKPHKAALVGYIGLFRSAKRDLASDRALRLCHEVVALGPIAQLVPALNHTLESMRAKQQQGQFKPLTNHNYLKRVIENYSLNSTHNAFDSTANSVPLIDTSHIQSTGNKGTDKRSTRSNVTQSIMDINDTNW
jgi:hypothetical protein